MPQANSHSPWALACQWGYLWQIADFGRRYGTQLFGIEKKPGLKKAEERPVNASSAAEQYVEDLKAFIPMVREHLGKAQAALKRAFDARAREKSNQLEARDWVYLDAHSRSPKKLGFMTRGH